MLQTFAASERSSIMAIDLPNKTSSGGSESIGSVRALFLGFGNGMGGYLHRGRCTRKATSAFVPCAQQACSSPINLFIYNELRQQEALGL